MSKDDIASKIEAKLSNEQALQPSSKENCQFTEAEIWKACTSQQDGDAWLFSQLLKDKLLFDHADGCWYERKVHYWEKDKIDNVIRLIDELIDLYAIEASKMSNQKIEARKKEDMKDADKFEGKEKVYLKKISKIQQISWKKDVLKLSASGKNSLGIPGDEWDKDPWLLGCSNGVLELKTGIFRPGKPDDYIKSACPTEWKGINESCPIWENSLLQIFDNNKLLIDFVQRVFGYSITGDKKREHIFPILEGPEGQNGKGTILETILSVLGPLSGPVESEMMLDQGRAKSSTGPSPDIMDLRGKRIVWASETNEGRKFNLGKVKWLTGGDTLKARSPFGRSMVEFQPTHTLFLVTNNKPKANSNDAAFWKRVFLIPFHISFIDNPDPNNPNQKKADFKLFERLKSEPSGILAWLVSGCMEWQRRGLNPPDIVRMSTQEYQNDEDIIGHFLDDVCFLGPEKRVKANDFYEHYKRWCDESGHYKMNKNNFGKNMKKRFDSDKGRVGRFYFGVGISDDPF